MKKKYVTLTTKTKNSRLKNTSNNVVSLDANPRIVWNEDNTKYLDLNPYFEGKEKKSESETYAPFDGQPTLIKQLVGAIKRVAKQSGNLNYIQSYLNSFWKFLHDTNRKDASLSDINVNLLAEHSEYLIKVRGLTARTLVQLSADGKKIISELTVEYARDFPALVLPNGDPIKYPPVKSSNNRKIKDISLFANEYLYKFCLHYLKQIDDEQMTKVTPFKGGDVNNIAHVLEAIEQMTFQRMQGVELPKWTNISLRDWISLGFERRPLNSKGMLVCNRKSGAEAIDALFPDAHEIAATLFIISYDTGWLDTARNINIEEDWYSTDAVDAKNVKSADKVNLYARRPKTDKAGEAPKGSLTSGKYGSAYWAINRILKRTERLRSFTEDRLANENLTPVERAHLTAAVRNPLIYLGVKYWNIQIVDNKNIRDFHKYHLKPHVELDTDLTEAQKEEIAAFTWKDTRDAKALKTLEDTNDVYLVQQLLGHKDLTTTFEYLRARVLKKKFYEQFAEASGIIYDEVSNGFEINTDIIRARFLTGDNLTEEQREKLSGITVSGARCSDIENPPAEIGNLGKGPCQQQSCILCPKAVFLPKEKRALSTFAKYYASLVVKADDLAPERFRNSILEAEITALSIYKNEFFGDRIDQFEEVYETRLKLLQEIREAA